MQFPQVKMYVNCQIENSVTSVVCRVYISAKNGRFRIHKICPKHPILSV